MEGWGKEITPPPRASAASAAKGEEAVPHAPPRGSSATDLAFSIGLAFTSSKSPPPPGQSHGMEDVGGSGRKRGILQQPHSTGGYPGGGGDYFAAGGSRGGASGSNSGGVWRLTKEAISSLIEGPENALGLRSAPGSYGTISGQSSAHTSMSDMVSRHISHSGVSSREKSSEDGGGWGSSHAPSPAGAGPASGEQDADFDRLRQSLPPELREYGAPSEHHSSPYYGGGRPAATPPPMERGTSAPALSSASKGAYTPGRQPPGVPALMTGGGSSGSLLAAGSPRASDRSGRSVGSEKRMTGEAWEEGSEDCGRRGSQLSDAVMRKLKSKNAQVIIARRRTTAVVPLPPRRLPLLVLV